MVPDDNPDPKKIESVAPEVLGGPEVPGRHDDPTDGFVGEDFLDGEDVSAPPPELARASEEAIREELGILNSGGEEDREKIDELLAGAKVGYEKVFSEGDSEADPGDGETVEGGGDRLEQNLDLLRDVNMKVKVELGRGHMFLKDILRLGQGSVVELERLAGDPLDIYVNDMVIARGEVLVLNENFCIRITEIHDPGQLVKQKT